MMAMLLSSLVSRRVATSGTNNIVLVSSSTRTEVSKRGHSSVVTAGSSLVANTIPRQGEGRSHHTAAAAAAAAVSTYLDVIANISPYNYSHEILHRRNVPSFIHHHHHHIHLRHFSSKYIAVDHSAAYQDAMSSSHGMQLQLALEEGRGKDDAPFDPFSQFLDGMGSTVNDLDDDDYDEEEEEEIEEAEYKTIESHGSQINDYDDVDDDLSEQEEEENTKNDGNLPTYTTTGALYRPKSERLALRAGYPAGGNFAVIHLAGFQHKVTVDDLLVVNKLKPIRAWSVGSTHTIKDADILLLANQDKTLVGLPGVMGGEVDVMVEEITRDKTLIVFKKRRRKNSRRKNGFRRQVTFLRVLDVRMPGEIQVGEKGRAMEEDVVNVAA